MMLERVKQITPDWAKVALLQDVERFTTILNCFNTIKSLELLKEKLKKHWEDTKEEREKTHTTKIHQKKLIKKSE